jgi:hypothetical protein
MSRSVYLFVTSPRPDQYVNVITHCLTSLTIDHVVFVHVSAVHGEAAADEKDMSAAVYRNVTILLSHLASGQYRHFGGDRDGSLVDLAQQYSTEDLAALKQLYRTCQDRKVKWSHRQVPYSSLRQELARSRRAEPQSLYDVTAVSKSLLGDVVALSILEGIRDLYTFDLRTPPTFDEPWRMLWHDLAAVGSMPAKYSYVNIVDTPVFREASGSILVRTPSLVISLGAAVVLLGVAVGVYYVRGMVNPFIQVTSIASAVSSLLALFLNFFPPRRS